MDYYVKRCRANLEMLIRTDFISRTSELARLFGILFYSVISRGSQVWSGRFDFICDMLNTKRKLLPFYSD